MTEKIFDNVETSSYEFVFFNNLEYIRLRRPKMEGDKLEYTFPDESGILVKTYFEKSEEGGRSYPHQTYYNYNPDSFGDDLENMDKKSITNFLKDQLIEYIKENNRLGPLDLNEKGKLKKNNAVKYELKFGSYLTFNLQLAPLDLEVDDVSLFITGLERDKKEEKEENDPWKVELAKSGRASCRECGNKIEKQTIRLGEPSYYDGHLSYKWYHLTCKKDFDENTSLSGLTDLPEEEKEKVTNHLYRKRVDVQSIKGNPKDSIIFIINEFEDSDGLTAESDIYKQAKNKFNMESDKVKELLEEMVEEAVIYRPDQGKIKLI